MIALDLFCGAGGATIALESLGYSTIGFDNNTDACRTHEQAGHMTIQLDLATAAGYFKRKFDGVDMIHASPPCQPFSNGGKGTGQLDPRDGMPWTLRAIAELRPRLVTVENVKGLTFLKHWEYLDWFLRNLRALGYSVDHKVLNCANYGVPQTRERLMIVGRRDGVSPKWPDPTHAKDGKNGLIPWVSMAEALGWDSDDLVGFPRLAETESNRAGNGRVELNGVEYRSRDLQSASDPSNTSTEKVRSWKRWTVQAGRDAHATQRSVDEPAPTVLARKDPNGWRLNTGMDWKPGGSREEAQTRPTDEPVPTIGTRTGRSQWWLTRPSTTIAGDPRVFTPGGHIANDGRDNSKMAGRSADVVRVELAELAVLQGFPADYPFQGTKTSRARQIGNALPPQLLAAVVGVNR